MKGSGTTVYIYGFVFAHSVTSITQSFPEDPIPLPDSAHVGLSGDDPISFDLKVRYMIQVWPSKV
jgi:hypothetical protein